MRILGGNSCITSHQELRAGRRPPSAGVYNNLQPFTQRRKAGKEECDQKGATAQPRRDKGGKTAKCGNEKEAPALAGGEARFELSLRRPCRANNGDAAVIRRSYV